MQVQTFECEETKAEHPECTAEALKLMEELGMETPQKLLPGDANAKRSPYREMTAEEIFVYQTLCPESTALHHFRSEPIPLRVLQIAAHAKSLGEFRELRVWSRKSPAVKDPVLVGVKPDAQYSWQERFYILARWGEVLDEWPALVTAAMSIFKKQYVSACEEIRTDAEAAIAGAEKFTLDRAVIKSIPSCTF